MKNFNLSFCKSVVILIVVLLSSCHKDDSCKGESLSIVPFSEKFAAFECNPGYLPFQCIFWHKYQLDSLTHTSNPDCHFGNPVILPLDDSGYVYIAVGDTLFNDGDTITTKLTRDPCNKVINYSITYQQRVHNYFPAIVSTFCVVDHVSPDYKITIKKKRINLP